MILVIVWEEPVNGFKLRLQRIKIEPIKNPFSDILPWDFGFVLGTSGWEGREEHTAARTRMRWVRMRRRWARTSWARRNS